MKVYLWYSKATSKTGKELALSMGLTRRRFNDRDRGYGTLPPPINTTHCVVWGAHLNNWIIDNFRWKRKIKWLNNPREIQKYTNKYLALRCMVGNEMERQWGIGEEINVDVPAHTDNKEQAMSFNFPLVGRKIRHQGGSGFHFIETPQQLRTDNSDYWTEYIDGEDKREYRVHVFNGQVVKVQRKREIEGESVDYRCRSHNNGWYFSMCDINRIHSDIIRNAKLACNSLKYDFGAVDIIRIPSTNTTKVLEVNSGMGLDNQGVEQYTELIKGWLNGN
jgi:glutathione synthase/RimK-type ligase-like ATP-grasp enzyme